MGGDHYRFRLSEIVPHSWVSKLRLKNRAKNQEGISPTSHTHQLPSSPPRKSQYFTRDLNPTKLQLNSFNSPGTTSQKSQRPRGKTVASHRRLGSAMPSRCSRRTSSPPDAHETPAFYYCVSSTPCSPTEYSFPPEFGSERLLTSFDRMVSWSTNPYKIKESEPDDAAADPFGGQIPATGLDLPPIITKPQKFNDMVSIAKKQRQRRKTKSSRSGGCSSSSSDGSAASGETRPGRAARKPSVASQGVRLRVKSPRVACRRPASGTRSVSCSSSTSSSSLSDSFAVVKSSFDPYKDFRESMVEMIVENNIWSSKDMEDLLVCYLSLNSDEYHDLIIKVFKQIWIDLLAQHHFL